MADDPNIDPYGVPPQVDPYVAWMQSQLPAPGGSDAPAPDEIEMPAMDARTGEEQSDGLVNPYADQPVQPAEPNPFDPRSVDAVSGGTAPPDAHQQYLNALQQVGAMAPRMEGQTPDDETKAASDERYQAFARGEKDPQARADELAGMTPEDKAKAYDAMTPEERIGFQVDRNKSMVARQAAAQAKADTENWQRQQDDLRMQQAAAAKADADTKQLMADAARVANTKVDPGRYKKNLGVLGRIADFIAISVGGAMSGGTGGKNLALEAFDKQVNDDIAAQSSDIQNQWKGVETRKGAIAQEYERHGDMYRAQETYRIGAYQAAINAMQTDLQQYDPQGATAIAKRDQIDQFHARQAQALQQFNTQNQKSAFDAMKATSEYAEKLAATEKLKVETAALRAKAAGTGMGAPAPVEHALTSDQWARIYPGAPVPPAELGPMTATQRDAWVENASKGAEAATKIQANQMQQAGATVRNPVTGDPLLDEKGKPILMGDAQLADKVNETSGWAQKYLDAMSSVRNALASDPSTFDRRKWAEIQANLGTAEEGHIKYLGAKVSSRELDATKEIMNTDFDGYINRVKDKGKAIASFDAFIKNLKRDTDTELKVKLGYKGPSPLFDSSNPPEATKTAIDKLGEQLSVVVPEGESLTDNPIAAMAEPGGIDELRARADRQQRTGMLDTHSGALDQLKSILASGKTGDKERNDAIGVLHKAAVDGPTDAIRNTAARILADYTMSQTQGEKEQVR